MPAGHSSLCVHEMPSEKNASKEFGIRIPTVWMVMGSVRAQAARYPTWSGQDNCMQAKKQSFIYVRKFKWENDTYCISTHKCTVFCCKELLL